MSVHFLEGRTYARVHARLRVARGRFDTAVLKRDLRRRFAVALGFYPELPFSTDEILKLVAVSEPLASALAALEVHDTR
jgi:hypothetical protein